MAVREIKDHQDFLATISKPGLTVVDFTASWCEPCKVIKPTFHSLAKEYPNTTFVSVDVDMVQESAAMAKVTAMPTFKFYRNGQSIHEMKGANKEGLSMLVKQLAGADNLDSSGKQIKAKVPGQIDLSPFISKNIECLNFDSEFPVQNIFMANSSVLKSDVDEQLIIGISFTQPVKLHSLKFISDAAGPKNLKTFINRASTLSFDEVDSISAVEDLELKPEDLKEDTSPVGLRFVKYQNVHHLTIFISDNQEESDVTTLRQLILYGTPIEATKDVR